MRQIYITFTAALMALVANAHPISPGEAETIATDFFNSGSATRNTPHKVARAVTPNTQFFKSPAYYIFNVFFHAEDGIRARGDIHADKQ